MNDSMWPYNGFQGTELEAWKGARLPRINDMVITTDGSHMVSICAHKDIRVHNLEERTDRVTEDERPITSLSISNDESCSLVNLVHIWRKGKGELLDVLPGHSGTVNSVSWNPVNPHIFTSASYDHTI